MHVRKAGEWPATFDGPGVVVVVAAKLVSVRVCVNKNTYHSEAPPESIYRPNSQSIHRADPDGALLPVVQIEQIHWPLAFAYEPAGHGVQLVVQLPSGGSEKRPGSQAWQWVPAR